MAKASPKVVEAHSTRDRIMMTALHLFATEGLDAVTLRSVGAAAGSANTSAVQYHFGNKLGLIRAIIGFLDAQVWQPGYANLVTTVADTPTIRELLKAGLWPAKCIVFDFPWGGDAQAFSFQVVTGRNEHFRVALHRIQDKHMPLFKRSLKRALPELSGAVFEQRWQFLITEAVVGQWARARLLMTPGTDHASWTPAKERLYLERYFEYVEGGLTAPMTA